MNTEDFATYEQAVKLKELGFDWPCHEFWDNSFWLDDTPAIIRKSKSEPKICVISECNSTLDKTGCGLITAPSLAKAAKWLRNTKGIYVYPDINCVKMWFVRAVNMKNNKELVFDGEMYDTYEVALSAGIDRALEIIENLCQPRRLTQWSARII